MLSARVYKRTSDVSETFPDRHRFLWFCRTGHGGCFLVAIPVTLLSDEETLSRHDRLPIRFEGAFR